MAIIIIKSNKQHVIFLIATCLLLSVFSHKVFAADLVQVFQQALQVDPELEIESSKRLSRQQEAPITRADLLPKVDANTRYIHQNSPDLDDGNTNGSNFNLTLKQPLFNAANWLTYRSAKINAVAAELAYKAALQDLMVRTAQAYFDVLQAQDTLRLSKENQHTLAAQLQQVKIKFSAGLVKTVDVDTAQAAYEDSLADVIDKQNAEIAQQAKLQAITGIYFYSLARLKPFFPLLSPDSLQLNIWLEQARLQNLTVLADRTTAHALREKIAVQQAGHYPSLAATANYTRNLNNAPQIPNSTRTVGLEVDIPLFSGGKVIAQTRQAAYDYQMQLGQMALDYHKAAEQTQTSYFGVVNGIRKLEVDRKSIRYYQQALKSTELAYNAGLSHISIRDLLDAQYKMYTAQQSYAADQYNYLTNLLKLKQAAGSLNIKDLNEINSWLE